jgi:hypothetical protein
VSRELRVVDGADGALAAPALPLVGVPGAPAWSEDGSVLWLPEREPAAVTALDGETLAELTRRELPSSECASPREVIVAGARLLLLCAGDETSDATLLTLDAQTLATIASSVLTKPVRGLAWVAGARGGR